MHVLKLISQKSVWIHGLIGVLSELEITVPINLAVTIMHGCETITVYPWKESLIF